MTCDKCGREYPSQYYFNFNAVPGLQICTECMAVLTPPEIASLRLKVQTPRRPAGLAPNEYVFPQKCCSCLGPAETNIEARTIRNEGAYIKTLRIQVPVCRSCAKRGKITSYFVAGGIVLGALIGFLVGGILAGIVLGVLGIYAGVLASELFRKMTEPATIDKNGFISFRNPKYEALFRAANSR